MRGRWMWSGLVAALVVGSALPAAAQAADTPADKAKDKDGAKPAFRREDGKTTFEFGDGSLSISNRLQFRWTEEMPDEPTSGGSGTSLVPTSPPIGDRGSFRIRRAKTELTGWIWKKELTYELQLSWAGPEAGASTQTPLEDLTMTWDISKKGTFAVTGGQFKVPFGRQEHTTSSKLQFLDRDILSGEFTRGRDVGVQVSGLLSGGKLEYMAGIFNGNPASRINNENDKYQFDGRVAFMPFGTVKYSESDFESKDKPLLSLAAEFEHNDQHGSTNADDFKTTIVGGDLVFKYKGFSAFAEYFGRHREPETSAKFDSPGFHAQAGMFLIRDRLEVAGRYATYDPSDAIANNDRTEIGGVVSYFMRKHLLKVQSDFRQIEDEARDTKDQELRVQLAVVF
jgi:phosphate-selective porin OprO/OprP